MAATENHADLVFEGGGVKGIGLVGVPATLEERGYRHQNVAGTSAGSISAALLAGGYTAAELREIILELDYRQFQDKGWEDKVPLIERSLSMLIYLGFYEGEVLPGVDPRTPRGQGNPHVRRPRPPRLRRRPPVPLPPPGGRIRRDQARAADSSLG